MARNVNRVMMFVIWIGVFIFALTLAENTVQTIALIGILVVVLGTFVALSLTRQQEEGVVDLDARLAAEGDEEDDYAEYDNGIYELEEREV